MRIKISIIGGSLTGNRGAEAMLISSIGRIRERLPDVQFVVYTCHPSQDRRVLFDNSVILHSSTPWSLLFVLAPFSGLLGILKFFRLGFLQKIFPSPVRDLAASAALIDLAGVSFIDGREKYLPYNVLTIFPALALRVPVYKLSQAMGPFENYWNRLFARLILGSCRRVYARGDQTLTYLRGLGIDEMVIAEASDIAFLRTSQDSLTNENSDHMRFLLAELDGFRASGRPVMGVCPSAVIARKTTAQGGDYVEFLANLVQACVDHDLYVLLFSNSMREHFPHKRKNNDLPYIQETIERLKVRNASVLSRVAYTAHDLNADAIGNLMNACDVTVVSRFHAMVGSLAGCVPTLVLGWSHKYLEVMRQFNQQDWVQDYSSLDDGFVVERLLDMLARREELSIEIRSHRDGIKAFAEQQIEDIVEYVHSTIQCPLK